MGLCALEVTKVLVFVGVQVGCDALKVTKASLVIPPWPEWIIPALYVARSFVQQYLLLLFHGASVLWLLSFS